MSEVPAKLAALGLDLDDWRRIRKNIAAIRQDYAPPALRDLSAPLVIAAVRDDPRYRSTETIGFVTRPDGLRVKLLSWPMSEHERGHWRRARAERGS